MKLLSELSQHLLNSTRLKRENISSFADNGELIISGQDFGHGFEVARFKYDAVINLERYAGGGPTMNALVAGWLIDNDPDREDLNLSDPEINIEIVDDKTVDVEIIIEFNESIQIVEDPQGSITAWGKRWRVSDVPVDTATELADMESSTDE